ncbi:MAG: hypothetical protein IJI34_01740 [Clostridia bacterium]|nr:hypothetical protein [Clostridia bacterium]
MEATEIRMLKNVEMQDREYVVNGVRYIVASRFLPFRPKMEAPVFLRDRLDHYLTTNTAELTFTDDRSTLNAECVCAAVGKEAYAAEKEKD